MLLDKMVLYNFVLGDVVYSVVTVWLFSSSVGADWCFCEKVGDRFWCLYMCTKYRI